MTFEANWLATELVSICVNGPSGPATYTTFYMELIPCINCVSVGVADYIGVSKSLAGTFFRKIGSIGGFPRSLYKTCWSLVGVNFLLEDDDERILTGSMYESGILSGFCSATEPLVISEGSILLPRSAEPVGVPGAALPCGVGSPFSGALRE